MEHKLTVMQPLTLKEFITQIAKGVWADCVILFQGTAEETLMLSEFTKKKLSKGLRNHAWSVILDSFEKKLTSIVDAKSFLSETVLCFLIDNEIDLLELWDLKFSEEWQMKIQNKLLTKEDRLIEREPLTLHSFIKEILNGVWVSCEILLQGTAEETVLLQKFCKARIKVGIRAHAWYEIIYWIAENFSQIKDPTTFIGVETLNFLIDNEIDLIGLGHLQLSDYWLQKIYDKDNRCIEALQTIQARKNTKGAPQ